MANPDLLIRHLPVDARRAAQLAAALARYGYVTEPTTTPLEPGRPALLVWSRAAINDDALIWECAQAARVESGAAPAPIHQAILEPIAAKPAIHPYFSRHIPNRLLQPVDLSEWEGDTESDLLAPLIWSMPLPAAPSPSPPHPRAATLDEARWRALRVTRDVVAMAAFLRFKIRPVRSREDAAAIRTELDETRAIGADPAVWVRYGPRTAAAAAEGPAALRAWADELNDAGMVPDPGAPDSMRTISAFANLMFAIQICVGVNKRLTFSQDLRTDEEVIALIESGDSATITANRYNSSLLAKVLPAIERLALENNAAALEVLADLPGTPDYRRRLLSEKAAALGNAEAIRSLIRALEYKRKFREMIPLLRQGAELGDRECKRELAEALDAGKHVKRDAKAAFALYNELVMDENWRDTQIALRIAQMRWDGDGCPRDREAAAHAFFDLHIGDEAPFAAAIFIGDLYRDGLAGISQDRDEAIAWYRGATSYNGVEAAVARKRLKEMKVKLTEEDGEDDEFEPDEIEKLRTFWRARA